MIWLGSISLDPLGHLQPAASLTLVVIPSFQVFYSFNQTTQLALKCSNFVAIRGTIFGRC